MKGRDREGSSLTVPSIRRSTSARLRKARVGAILVEEKAAGSEVAEDAMIASGKDGHSWFGDQCRSMCR